MLRKLLIEEDEEEVFFFDSEDDIDKMSLYESDPENEDSSPIYDTDGEDEFIEEIDFVGENKIVKEVIFVKQQKSSQELSFARIQTNHIQHEVPGSCISYNHELLFNMAKEIKSESFMDKSQGLLNALQSDQNEGSNILTKKGGNKFKMVEIRADVSEEQDGVTKDDLGKSRLNTRSYLKKKHKVAGPLPMKNPNEGGVIFVGQILEFLWHKERNQLVKKEKKVELKDELVITMKWRKARLSRLVWNEEVVDSLVARFVKLFYDKGGTPLVTKKLVVGEKVQATNKGLVVSDLGQDNPLELRAIPFQGGGDDTNSEGSNSYFRVEINLSTWQHDMATDVACFVGMVTWTECVTS